MTLEQRPELSRLIDPSIIAPWEYRRWVVRMFLPATLALVILYGELGLFGAWLTGRPELVALAVGINLLAFPGSILLLAITVGTLGMVLKLFDRPPNRAQPTIAFNGDEIVYGRRDDSIKWAEIDTFQFEPIAGTPGMIKLSLSRSSRTGRKIVVYAIVIESPAKAPELAAYLHKRREEGSYAYAITVLEQPAPLFPAQPTLISDLVGLAGFIVFMDGMAILFQAFGAFELEKFARYRQFIARHFSGPAEFQLDCFNVGLLLLVAGCWLVIRHKREVKRFRALANGQD